MAADKALIPSMSVDEMMQEPADLEEDNVAIPSMQFQTGEDVRFDDGDIGYPRLRIGQAQTEEVGNKKAEAGQLILSGFPPMNTVTCVVIGFAKSRQYAIGTGGDRRTLCRSFDGKIGTGDPGGECRVCPKAAWSQSPSNPNKNKPPECDETYNYVLYVREYRLPVQVSFKKTGVATAKTLNSLINGRGLKQFAFVLYADKKTSVASNVPFYVPLITVLEPEGEILDFIHEVQEKFKVA